MARNDSFGKQNGTRTQITDLQETAVELSEREMRIVSGGLVARLGGCYTVLASASPALLGRTEYITGGDHDTDW